MKTVKTVVKETKRAIKAIGKQINGYKLYNYQDKDSREATVEYLYQYAKSHRSHQEQMWRIQDRYYNNDHVTQVETYKFCKENNIPWVPAIIPDPYIHVESQIIADVPDFQFNGRDDDLDSQKAKQREYVVKYVMEQNKIDAMNSENERTLGKHGNALWKVAWNASKFYAGTYGDIEIGNPDISNIFPDPSAVDIDDCEFIDFSYPIHKLKAGRIFSKQLEAMNMSVDDITLGIGNRLDTEIFDSDTHDMQLDTVQINEHWFRQPVEGKDTMQIEVDGKVVKIPVEWEAGDIACSISINFHEVQYIPKYWMKTGKQNKIYPFVKYCKIPIRKKFWDKSELDVIKDLVDAADRELAMAILNDTFTSNDIIVVEDNALTEGSEINNQPGQIVKVKSGMINSIRRLGGLQTGKGLFDMVDKIREIIQQAVGNFDSSMGNEPVRVTTASGIAQLNERADARKNIKKADRMSGFERLFELIDWTALEFYDDNRLIFIGAKKEGTDPIQFTFNSDDVRIQMDTNEFYYPRVDAVINAGDSMQKSKSFVLATTENLISKPINVSNYKIVEEMLDIMDTPNKKEIKDFYEALYAPELELKNATIQQQLQAIMNPPPPQQGGEVPQQQPTLEDIMGGLSPDELAHLSSESDPQLMEQIHGIVNGGQ
jgi:hypothetical protein